MYLYFVFKYKINCIYVFQIHINKFKYLCAILMTFTFVSGILGTVINALTVFYNGPRSSGAEQVAMSNNCFWNTIQCYLPLSEPEFPLRLRLRLIDPCRMLV